MNIAYITRVRIPSNAAQSVQIQAMAQAFYADLGERFCLISTADPEAKHDAASYNWRRISTPRNDRLRYLKITLIAFGYAWRYRSHIVFTRDIGVALAAVLVGARAIYEVHNKPSGRRARAVLSLLRRFRRCRFVAISNALKDYHIAHLAVSPEQILVAHSGAFAQMYPVLSDADKSEMRHRLGFPAGKVVGVHTGSLYKGGRSVFEALARAGGREMHLLLVGGTPREQDSWRRHFADCGLANIAFVPHQSVDRIREYQMAADFLVYQNTRQSAIHWATSPLKLFEYMATGVPIIGSTLGSVAEVLNPSNAICFDPDDPPTIEAAWQVLRENPAAARTRAGQAKREIEEHYSWHHRVSRIIDFVSSGNT